MRPRYRCRTRRGHVRLSLSMLAVGTSVSYAKMAEPIKIPFRVQTRVDPMKQPRIRRGWGPESRYCHGRALMRAHGLGTPSAMDSSSPGARRPLRQDTTNTTQRGLLSARGGRAHSPPRGVTSSCGGDVAYCQIYLDTCYCRYNLLH